MTRPSARASRISLTLIVLIALSSALVYLPGKSGPFIFDDYTNLVQNQYIKIRSLDWQSLYYAAFSLDSGPLRRPVSMLSFALNHYFAGEILNSTSYKLTNIVIHALNGILVFVFARLVITRLHTQYRQPLLVGSRNESHAILLTAAAAALLWSLHPIQLTSVLYVVQRMNSLSALFTLLALISYLHGRQRMVEKNPSGAWITGLGLLGWGALAILSKENALLLLLFVPLLEAVLFPSEKPWDQWRRLSPRMRQTVVLFVVIGLAISLFLAIRYALPGYAGRRFTLTEHLLTEGRVLFLYLSLILVPQIDRFSHQHDDIAISTSLTEPWTTLPSLAGHVVLIVVAIVLRRRQPLIALGLLWFYVGHVLESTIFPLEIAHEHRNYLPSIGIVFVLVGLLGAMRRGFDRPKIVLITPVIIVLLATVTALRAAQWESYETFYRYEMLHNPHSARVQVGFSILLEAHGDYEGAAKALTRAAEIEPYETGYLIQLQLLAARRGKDRPPAENERVRQMLQVEPLSTTTFLSIQYITECIQSSCRSLRDPLEQWLRIILAREKDPGDRSFYEYSLGMALVAKGRLPEAIDAFKQSHAADPSYLHPLFALANIYVQLGLPNEAAQILAILQQANRGNLHPRTREIELVARDIERLRRGERVIVPGQP
jgi:tetratricopeptide (TPR) repeat protein